MAVTNPWTAWLEDYPEAAYEAYRPLTGAPGFLNYWKQRYGDVYGSYMGSLGRTSRMGQMPTMSFMDFLGAYPFAQEWQGLGPRERGERSPGMLRWRIPTW